MAEEAKKTGEDANLNSQGGEGKDENPAEKTTYTKDEVEAMRKEAEEKLKKQQSDSDRWVQQLLDEKRFAETIIEETKKVSDDKKRLVTLSQTNPKVAKVILDKYYDGMTIDEFMEDEGLEVDLTDPEIAQKRIDSEAQKLYENRIISEKKDEFIAELKMTDEEKALFEEEFKQRAELKSFDIKDLRKHFEKAYREVNPDSNGKKLDQQQAIAEATSSASGSDNNSKRVSQLDKSRAEAKKFLKKFN